MIYFKALTILYLMVILAFTVFAHGAKSKNRDSKCPKSCMNKGKDCKIYVFGFQDVPPAATFNGKDFIGSRIDLMNEVCRRAGKRCEASLVSFTRCWERERGRSEVLDRSVLDACISIDKTARLEATFGFSGLPIFEVGKMVGVVKKDSALEESDFQQSNSFVVVYPSNPDLFHPPLLDLFANQNYQAGSFVGVDRGATALDTPKLLSLVADGDADMSLVPESRMTKDDLQNVKIILEIEHESLDATVMVRKDNLGILCWWDNSYLQFVCSDDYKAFCKKMKNKYGASQYHCLAEDTRDEICQ